MLLEIRVSFPNRNCIESPPPKAISYFDVQIVNKILFLPAVQQTFDTEAMNEYVILGNDVIVKCSVPSFVADFVNVVGWVDSEGNEFLENNGSIGVSASS